MHVDRIPDQVLLLCLAQLEERLEPRRLEGAQAHDVDALAEGGLGTQHRAALADGEKVPTCK
eukprot:14897098-Alexandrium_andersonii.AAC.1